MINKPELIEKIVVSLSDKGNKGIAQSDIKESFNYLVDFLTMSLKKRSRIEIRGFGVFESKFRVKRKAINPKSKRLIDLANRYSPSFKPSKFLNNKLSLDLKN